MRLFEGCLLFLATVDASNDDVSARIPKTLAAAKGEGGLKPGTKILDEQSPSTLREPRRRARSPRKSFS
ncbi:hypothetical protein [Rhizobium sp. PP-CC-3G-465]|uniref:hypothetical protein n=1 Tax=Rhizobium sp. PP-CC-3G-465 TaxID=2135648 RepID=UPI003BAA8914